MRAIFFGDAHLGRKTEKELHFLIKFMDITLGEADYVFVLGDMFEFYHGYDGFVYEWFLPFVEKLKELSKNGKKLYFLEGNHEFCLGRYFEAITLCKPLRRLAISLDGHRLYVSHGDEIRFSLINSFLRSKFTQKVMDLLGPKLSWEIAMLSRFLLSKKKKGGSGKIVNAFRRYAEMKFKEGFDVVILAHSHIPDVYEIKGGERGKLYLNTGDIVRDRTYVEYTTETGFNLRKHP